MVKTDRKPTNEELDAKAEEALREIEAMSDEDKEEKDDESETENSEEESEKDDSDGGKDDGKDEEGSREETPVAQAKNQETPAPVKKQSEMTKEELQEKLSASSREAIVLHAQNKRVQEAIKMAGSIPEPTEDELKKEYPDWEDLDSFSKKMAKDLYVNNKKMEVMTSVNKEFSDAEAWNKKVDSYIDDPATLTNIPELDGRQEEFKAFSAKPTRRGLDMEDLTKAFLYDISGKPKPKRGSQFPVGNAGPKEAPVKNDKLTIEEGARLRKSNYNEYVKAVKAGKIDTTSI